MNVELPDCFTGPAAWVADDLRDHPESWLFDLSIDNILELREVSKAYLDGGMDIGEISRTQFPLNSLSSQMDELKDRFLHGNGVAVLRGLPVGDMTLEQAACIFCGIGAHLGSARSQNAQGHILGHVKDTGASSSNPNTRIYQTAERQSFHTDSADLVGLLCWRDAKQGGESLLVSALSIYNRMKSDRPDLLRLLFEPIATDRRGEIPPGAKPYMEIPVFSWYSGHLTVFYQRQYIDSAQRFDGAPQLTAKHIDALDMFDSLANNEELHFGMRLIPGDMQFVYNHSQLHDRTSFDDWPEPENRRHMLRLWLSLEGDRPLPECFKQRYGSIEIGNRGGIITDKTRLHAPVDLNC